MLTRVLRNEWYISEEDKISTEPSVLQMKTLEASRVVLLWVLFQSM